MPADPHSQAGSPPPRHRRCAKCGARYPESTGFCAADGSPLELAEGAVDDRSGDVIADRYRLVRLIGEGGMGQVYEATHVHIDKRVAVKLLRRDVVAQNPEIISRFKQEARAASSIGHPAIVEIEDFAPLPDGGVYLAMELLTGASLAEHLRAHAPVPVEEAVRILVETARGLAAAHDAGIVHRDIKPENLFLAVRKGDASGRKRIKILDFGIAKVGTSGPSSLTQTGEVFGTPHYMSPEQALGRPVDARSDIYSLGVIGYQLLAGEVPFKAESLVAVLTQHVQQPPKPLMSVVPERVTPALAAAIDRALAKEPAARFQTMAELEAALGEALVVVPAGAAQGESSARRRAQQIEAVKGTLTPPPPRSAGNGRALLVAGLVLAAGVTVAVLALRRGPTAGPTTAQPVTTVTSTPTPPPTPPTKPVAPTTKPTAAPPRDPGKPEVAPQRNDDVIDPYATAHRPARPHLRAQPAPSTKRNGKTKRTVPPPLTPPPLVPRPRS